MVIRRAVLNYETFDENLPLYSYGEDYDLSIRLERYGLVGRFQGCIGVHLETPGAVCVKYCGDTRSWRTTGISKKRSDASASYSWRGLASG